ncbi:MAG: hypothetical protein IKV82_03910, partial [Akkermansia sp.]|nr:hypothetical protein [Akkermansia sp.]
GSPYRIDKQYSVGLRAMIGCGGRGNPPQANQSKKLQQPHTRAAAAVFPQQKITGSVLADPSVFTSFKQFF